MFTKVLMPLVLVIKCALLKSPEWMILTQLKLNNNKMESLQQYKTTDLTRPPPPTFW